MLKRIMDKLKQFIRVILFYKKQEIIFDESGFTSTVGLISYEPKSFWFANTWIGMKLISWCLELKR